MHLIRVLTIALCEIHDCLLQNDIPTSATEFQFPSYFAPLVQHHSLPAVLFLGGITTMVTFTAMCFVVGVYMLVCGIAVGVLEAPVLFYCCDLTKKFAPKVDLVTPLYRSIAYAL
jgi:hypothetical protein